MNGGVCKDCGQRHWFFWEESSRTMQKCMNCHKVIVHRRHPKYKPATPLDTFNLGLAEDVYHVSDLAVRGAI